MSAEHRGTTIIQVDGSTATVPFPPGAQRGWLAVAALIGGAQGIDAAPADWLRAGEITITNGAGGEGGLNLLIIHIFYRFIDEVDEEPTWDWNGAPNAVCSMSLFSGVHSVPYFYSFEDLSGSTTTLDMSRSAFVTEQALQLYIYASTVGGTIITPHASTTQIAQLADSLAGSRLMLAIERAPELANGPATIGARDATQVGAGFHGAFVMSIVPSLDEAEPIVDDARDLYKSILLRKGLGAYRQDRESNMAKVTAALGESDNAIGGLFGRKNFLDPSPPSRWSRPVFVTSAFQRVESTNVIIVDRPTGIMPGDVMLLFISKLSVTGSSGISAPLGWTAQIQGTTPVGGGALKHLCYNRVADGTEAATYTFTCGEADASMQIYWVVYRSCVVALYNGPYVDTSDFIFGTRLAFEQVDSVMVASFTGIDASAFEVPYMRELYDGYSSDNSYGMCVADEVQSAITYRARAALSEFGLSAPGTDPGIGMSVVLRPVLLES